MKIEARIFELLTAFFFLAGILYTVATAIWGPGYGYGAAILRRLGAEVIAIGTEPDGFNINRDVGSTAPGALVSKVRELRADIGIALNIDFGTLAIGKGTDRLEITTFRADTYDQHQKNVARLRALEQQARGGAASGATAAQPAAAQPAPATRTR